MPASVTLEALTLHTDPRGSVVEPLAPEALPAQRNVHVVLNEPGAVRGNHFHRIGTEVLTVFGPALVRMREGAGAVTDTAVPEGEVYRFTIPPGVSHAVRNTGTTPAVLVAFNTEHHDPGAPEVFRDVLLEG